MVKRWVYRVRIYIDAPVYVPVHSLAESQFRVERS